MKTKEQFKKELEQRRVEIIKQQNDELVRFEEATDFDAIYGDIEAELEESYLLTGEMYSEFNLQPYMPKEFPFESVSERVCEFYVLDIIMAHLGSLGYNVKYTDLRLTIN
jgi:hypothetical protein